MKPRVLMVDDVRANLIALEAALGGLDCELVPARSGEEALGLLREGPFAVVLLDVQMPEIDGYEVARRARSMEATRDIPIIFLTANDRTDEDVIRGYGTGAVDFLFKPLNPHVLRCKVQVFLDLQREIAAHKVTAQELEAFSYTVSHDLRAPLRSISSFGKFLRDEHATQLDATGRDYLDRVLRAATRMDALITDLLELARVRAGDLVRTDVDVSTLAQETVARLAAAHPERRVEVVVEPGLRAHADLSLCAVVLENLIGNAWKFTAKREGAQIAIGRDADTSELFVRDNGAGFDMSRAKKLFAPFARLHSPKEFEGTGIGLATVRRVVERHGGHVRAESSPDAGTTIRFTFRDG